MMAPKDKNVILAIWICPREAIKCFLYVDMGVGGKPSILIYRIRFYLHFRHLLGDIIDIYSVTYGRSIENIKNIPQYSGLRSCRFSYVAEP